MNSHIKNVLKLMAYRLLPLLLLLLAAAVFGGGR